MKYISTIFFALCLGWTWKVIHTEPKVSFQVHATLQARLVEIIEKSIIELKPDSDNFKILNIWTENLGPQQIKAHFTYRFDEVDTTGELIESIINGTAIITKEESVALQSEHWTVTEVKTNTGALNFREGIVINPYSKTFDSTTVAPTLTPVPTSTPNPEDSLNLEIEPGESSSAQSQSQLQSNSNTELPPTNISPSTKE